MNKTSHLKSNAPSSSAPQKNKQPTAPPVYKAQPAQALQPKSAKSQMPNTRTTPVAPPVYRPGATPKVLQAKRQLTRNAAAQTNTGNAVAQTNAPASTSPPHKLIQRKEANRQARTVQPSRNRNPTTFVPSRAKSSTIQRAESSGPSISSVEKDLATRFEHYIVPLEKLGRALINEKLIHVDEGKSYQANVERLMELFKQVHAKRGQYQDDVRARLSPEGLAYSESQRVGHKSEWDLLVEAIIKNFAEKGILTRELTEVDRLFLMQYMIHGATRTRPELRQMAEDAYIKQQGPINSKL